jgi:hypothetical protein
MPADTRKAFFHRAEPGPVDFAAPIGRRVRGTTLLIGVIVVGLVVLNFVLAFMHRMPEREFWILVVAPVGILAVLVPVALFSQVLGYRLTADELLILRRHRQNHFPLAGLRSVEVDPTAMEWSIKILGNDGLGAITGRFRNRKLGAYRAFVTDRARAVVLRWPDRCLVVSPDRPEEFAALIGARTGLKT